MVWPYLKSADADERMRVMWWDQQLNLETFSPEQCETKKNKKYPKLPLIPQPLNGPCGLLSALTGHTLRCLMDDVDNERAYNATAAKLEAAHAEAIGRMLFAAATTPPCPSLSGLLQQRNAGVCIHLVVRVQHWAPSTNVRACTKQIVHVATFTGVPSAMAAGALIREYACGGPGVRVNGAEDGAATMLQMSAASLLYSLVLTRGVDLITAELKGAPTLEGGWRPPSARALILHDDTHGQTGFCEDALLMLALVGRASNSVIDSAWNDRQWPTPRVGLLCGEMHEQSAPFLRKPSSGHPGGGVWLVLRGGHCTTMLAEANDATDTKTFYFLDGLRCAVQTIHAELEPAVSPVDTSENELKVVDVVGVRKGSVEREFHCICAADENTPGHDTARGHKWYCCACWQSSPRVYAYNDAAAPTCKMCGKPGSECGSSRWVAESAMPSARVRQWDRDHAPPLLKIVRVRWARAVLRPIL